MSSILSNYKWAKGRLNNVKMLLEDFLNHPDKFIFKTSQYMHKFDLYTPRDRFPEEDTLFAQAVNLHMELILRTAVTLAEQKVEEMYASTVTDIERVKAELIEDRRKFKGGGD